MTQITHLKNLGFEVDFVDDEVVFFFDANYYGYELGLDDFDEFSTANEITEKAMLFSPCCGHEVDRDAMMCPDCKEHV